MNTAAGRSRSAVRTSRTISRGSDTMRRLPFGEARGVGSAPRGLGTCGSENTPTPETAWRVQLVGVGKRTIAHSGEAGAGEFSRWANRTRLTDYKLGRRI